LIAKQLFFEALKTSLSGNTIPRHGQIDNPYQLISGVARLTCTARLYENIPAFEAALGIRTKLGSSEE
jgi:hypothetical protein